MGGEDEEDVIQYDMSTSWKWWNLMCLHSYRC